MGRSFAKFFLLALFATGGWSQGLRDKILQSQMSNSIDFSSFTQQQIDSLRQAGQPLPTSSPQANRSGNLNILDSLILAPMDGDSSLLDSAALLDSLPKRYSQRIFRRSPGSVFGSYQSALGRGFILGPGDEITVSLWGDKERQYDLTVNNAGKIFLEGIGLVEINGLTIEKAEEKLRQKLSRIYSGINRGTTKIEISQGTPGPVHIFVLGEVVNPGGFVFSGNSSILSAFYSAKGPSDIGTVRKVKLTRGDTSYALDLYDYLLKGEILQPHLLQDGDILFSDRAEALVKIEGDIGRPATYELKKGEGVKELLQFAGGANPTAATHKITLKRIFEDGRPDWLDLDTPMDYLTGKSSFELQDGDEVWVDTSSEESKNFINVTGPVKYPGTYESKDIKTVEDLIAKAGGLKEEAFLGRIHILRFNPDGSSQLLAYSSDEGNVNNVEVLGKDNVILYSIKDMYAPDSVEIAGAVFNPGKYFYSEGMTVKDLILRAGGFLPEHESGNAHCFRQKGESRKVDIITLNNIHDLKSSDKEFKLYPKDFILIPSQPNWYTKEIVTLSGEFKYPGKYALLHPGEKLASLIKRTGGFKEDAYIPGFRFHRHQDKVGRIGIDLNRVLKSKDNLNNLPLLHNDSLYIPKRQTTVKVIGEVGFASSVLYKKGASVNYYIKRAGGFTRLSDEEGVVLEYANGETTGDGDFYRDPDPGSVIFVPNKPEDPPTDWIGGFTALASVLTATLTILLVVQQLNK